MRRPEALKGLGRVVEQESAALEPYFPFWKDTELLDLKRRAGNYLEHQVINNGRGPVVEPLNASHMRIREQFGAAKFVVDVSEAERRNPYDSFDALAVRRDSAKEYSLHRIPESNVPQYQQQLAQALQEETKRYINQTAGKDKAAIPADWCNYCPHRGACMESYLAGDLVESGLTTGGESRRRARISAGRPPERTDRPIAASALSETSDAAIQEAPAAAALTDGPAANEAVASRDAAAETGEEPQIEIGRLEALSAPQPASRHLPRPDRRILRPVRFRLSSHPSGGGSVPGRSCQCPIPQGDVLSPSRTSSFAPKAPESALS